MKNKPTVMKKSQKLDHSIYKVMSINPVDKINDLSLLSTCLYFEDPSLAEWILTAYPYGSLPVEAATMAQILRKNKNLCALRADAGFFLNAVDGLMDLAVKDPQLGARLMPVFWKAFRRGTAHGLDPKILDELANLLENLRSQNGFLIERVQNGKVTASLV